MGKTLPGPACILWIIQALPGSLSSFSLAYIALTLSLFFNAFPESFNTFLYLETCHLLQKVHQRANTLKNQYETLWTRNKWLLW